MKGSVGAAEAASFAALLERVHAIGRDHLAPHAAAVDQDARFPFEAFAALKAEKMLSCYVPAEYGGLGLSVAELARVCEVLGQYCGNSAMVFAMHQIQVGCIVHHALGSPYFQEYAREIAANQLLLASATTELGVGGDVRSSRCAIAVDGGRFSLEKAAPVISYSEAADAILVTARRSADALPTEQVHVLARKQDLTLEPLSTWDTLGFRGTCSAGYTLRATGAAEQVLPVPYADIHAKTMHPFAHTLWSALWVGIAGDAVNRARNFVRAEARKTPGTLPPTTFRLAELDAVFFTMRSGAVATVAEYQRMLDAGDDSAFVSNFGWALQLNNLKIATSKLLIEVVSGAMLINGIAGYRNDSPHSLCRHLRDSFGASLMVHNDRILGQSQPMQIVRRER